MIGALTASGELASFSERGALRLGYTFGEKIILAGPDNFYTFADGTSFSTPLVLRSISQNTSRDQKLVILRNTSPAIWTRRVS